MTRITVAPHPDLDVGVFITAFPRALGDLATPASIGALFAAGAAPPLASDDAVRAAVRDLLRVGGFKPTGRSKPASEYLLKAIEEGWLAPDKGINPAVDTCNAVSLHSGLPISVVDADLAVPPWRIALCAPDTSYVFNPTGQVIDVGGLVTFHDADGPCAGPVKDAQRTKTHAGTVRTLSVVWGTHRLAGRTASTLAWYRELLAATGATTEAVTLE